MPKRQEKKKKKIKIKNKKKKKDILTSPASLRPTATEDRSDIFLFNDRFERELCPPMLLYRAIKNITDRAEGAIGIERVGGRERKSECACACFTR